MMVRLQAFAGSVAGIKLLYLGFRGHQKTRRETGERIKPNQSALG
jgi:hypothetical protein